MATTIKSTYNLQMTVNNATGLDLASSASISQSLGNVVSNYTADTDEFGITLTLGTDTPAGQGAEIDLVNGDYTDKNNTGATIEDSFGATVTMDKIRTLGFYGGSSNSGNITVTIDRGTGTDLVFEVQPGSAIGCEFANLLTSGGTTLDIDFVGTADDTINVLITGIDAA